VNSILANLPAHGSRSGTAQKETTAKETEKAGRNLSIPHRAPAGSLVNQPYVDVSEAFLFGRARRAPASNSSNLDFAFSRETLALSPKYFLVKMYPGLVSAQSFHLATHIPLASDQTPVRSG
jgi:hypothetical protein